MLMTSVLFTTLSKNAIYLDPGSGSFLLQLLVAGIAALGIVLGTQWARIKRLFGKKKSIEQSDEDEDEDEESRPDA